MHKLIGFVQGEVVNKIDSLSRRYMLFYSKKETDYSDIRIVNHTLSGQFLDLETGIEIKLEDIEEFIIYDDMNIIIFKSENIISNEELVIQYGIVLQDLTS
jgi:hypothetical protein